jgi:hypothetical protein
VVDNSSEGSEVFVTLGAVVQSLLVWMSAMGSDPAHTDRRVEMLVQAPGSAEGAVAEVALPRTSVPGLVGGGPLLGASVTDELLGEDTFGVLVTDQVVKLVAANVSLWAAVPFEVVGESRRSGAATLAEWAQNVLAAVKAGVEVLRCSVQGSDDMEGGKGWKARGKARWEDEQCRKSRPPLEDALYSTTSCWRASWKP